MLRARDIPNIISVIRILLVAPVVWAYYEGEFGLALLLFFVAGVSDAIDGYLAKRYSWQSHLGSILDPLADKLLLVSTYAMLAWIGIIPLWLVATVIARDVIIMGGSFAYYLLYGRYEMQPSLISKLNTTAQIVMILVVVASLSVVEIPSAVNDFLMYFVLGTTVLSGLDYIVTWGVKAWRNRFNRY